MTNPSFSLFLDFDPEFARWVDACAALISQYGDAFHDDEEGRLEASALLCLAADHVWRTGDSEADPSWAHFDIPAFLEDLVMPEGPAFTVATLMEFVAFLCQQAVLGPAQTVKLMTDLERVAKTTGDDAPPVFFAAPLGRWAKVAQA